MFVDTSVTSVTPSEASYHDCQLQEGIPSLSDPVLVLLFRINKSFIRYFQKGKKAASWQILP